MTRSIRRPKRAILERVQPVEIRNVSRGGCCVESDELLPVGAFGVLTVDVEGELRGEVFRVVRTGVVETDAQRYTAGIEFLPMPAAAASLVEVIADIDRG